MKINSTFYPISKMQNTHKVFAYSTNPNNGQKNDAKTSYSQISFKAFVPSLNIYKRFNSRNQKGAKEFLDLTLNFEGIKNLDYNEKSDLIKSNGSMQNFVQDLYSVVRSETYAKGGITMGEFLDILKNFELKNIDDILAQVDKKDLHSPDIVKMSLEIRHDFVNYMIDELSKVDKNIKFLEDGEEIMVGIANSFYEKKNAEFAKYNEEIKAKLEYGEGAEFPKFNLEEEIKKLPEEKQAFIQKKFGGNYQKMMERYVAEGCMTSRAPVEYSVGVDTALIQMLPQYEQTKKNDIFEITPLTRRLRIDNLEEFMKQFEVGKIYSYPKTQSCSKDNSGSEVWYNDSRRELNVVLRIHPKAKLTKAYDIKDIDANKATDYDNSYDDMCERYYYSEVLYPPNTQFKVLGTTKYCKNNHEGRLSSVPDYYKTIIDLQEV